MVKKKFKNIGIKFIEPNEKFTSDTDIKVYNNNLYAKEKEMRDIARKEGEKLAVRAARKVDTIFTPRKLNPDDCKVIFHPVDYVVFNGDKANSIENLIFLDRKIKSPKNRRLQNSIRKTVEKENYEI